MVSFNEFFDSEYLKASDLQGREVAVRISHVDGIDLGGKRKAILYFEGKKKGLILNKTNANKIANVYGQNFEGWAGKDIFIYPDETTFQGQMVPCLRVRIPGKAASDEPLPF